MPRQRRRGRKEKKDDKKVDAPIDTIDDLDQQQHQPDQPASMNHDQLDQDRKFRFTSYGRVEEEIMGYFKHVEETLDDPPFETAEGISIYLLSTSFYIHTNDNRSTSLCGCCIQWSRRQRITSCSQSHLFAYSWKAVDCIESIPIACLLW